MEDSVKKTANGFWFLSIVLSLAITACAKTNTGPEIDQNIDDDTKNSAGDPPPANSPPTAPATMFETCVTACKTKCDEANLSTSAKSECYEKCTTEPKPIGCAPTLMKSSDIGDPFKIPIGMKKRNICCFGSMSMLENTTAEMAPEAPTAL